MKTYDDIFATYNTPPEYDYYTAVKDDIKQYIEENGLKDRDLMYDDCFLDDAVTGNASGSYYCNSYRAAIALAGNVDLLIDAIEEFGDEASEYKRCLQSPEIADCTIRCFLVGQMIDEAITEYIDEHIPENIKAEIDGMDTDDMIDYIIDNQIIA